jgi:5-methylcytosine-specific restriction endonuclease McrA
MMYGAGYKARRDAVIASSTHCALCGIPFQLGDLVEADHITPDANSHLQAVHRLCNQRKSNK